MGIRKSTLVSGMVVLAVAVGFAAAAFACTALATLQVPPTGTASGNVPVTGSAFSTAGAPVIIHWGSATGPEIGRAAADGQGSIATTVKVPADAVPGQYVVVATQDENGRPAQGTPARASMAVAAADGTVPAAPAAAARTATVQPAASSDSGSVGLLTVALAVAGAALVVAAMVVTRQRRRPERASAVLD